MPKTPSPKLFRLIKSLSGTERRYFKLWANPTGDKSNKYILLFDAIEAQDSFDDIALQQLVYPDEPVESRKYSELKSYLYIQILKALQAYDEKTSVEYRLKNALLNVKVLFKRALFNDCKEELQKAKKTAEEYDHFTELLEILRWEKEIGYAMTDIGFLDSDLCRIQEEEDACLEKIELSRKLRNLFFQLLVELRKEVSRSEEQLLRLKTIMDDPVLAEKEAPDFHTGKILRLRILSGFYFVTRDFKNFHASSRSLLDLMVSKPHFLEEEVSEYISALNNHLIACGQLELYDELQTTLQKLLAVKPLTKDDELKIHRQYYSNMFRFCINTGDFEEGLHAMEKHMREAEKFEKTTFEKGGFYFQYFTIYFGAGNYERALHYLNEWLSMPKNIERQDLQALARVLNLVLHYEMGNKLLVESLVRSTQRYLKKEKRMYAFERRIMEFLGHANDAQSRKEMKQAFEKLASEMDTLLQSPQERQMMKMFDFPAWVASKVSGKTFAEVVRENFVKTQN